MSQKNLDQGILLEDIDTLIPWGVSATTLRKVARPKAHIDGDSVTLHWNKHKVFGGIEAQVVATFYDGPMRSKTANVGGILSLVSLGFYNPEKLSPRAEHELLKKRMSEQFGEPSFDGKGSEPFSDLPFTEWDLPEALLVLMVFERFGEYCVGEVWRKPLPEWRVQSNIGKSA